MLLGSMAPKLREVGVQTVGIVATTPERARTYFRFRPPRFPMGADPDLATHRAYGLPNSAFTPEIAHVAQAAAARELRRLNQEVPADAFGTFERLDGFEATETDQADAQRHQAQLTGLFLVDRAGVVRWGDIECERDGPAGLGQLPSEQEILAAAGTI